LQSSVMQASAIQNSAMQSSVMQASAGESNSLDAVTAWEPEQFEQAVIAAASLYFYALQQQLQVSLWTAKTGVVQGKQAVLETLAATHAGEELSAERLPDIPLLWLTQNSGSLSALPSGSRWLLWHTRNSKPLAIAHSSGLVVQSDQPLQTQLQAPL
jgi:uncharacterized protein (DUF58 family)